MSIETTVLDFKLSNTFEEYEAHMNAPEQQAMFKEMGVKTFYIGKSLEDPKRATVMFQGPVNTCYDIFVNPETKPIVEASGHIYEGTIITAGFLNNFETPTSCCNIIFISFLRSSWLSRR